MKDLKTPKWIDSLIDSLAPAHLAEEIRGDLYEIFTQEIKTKGVRSARWHYVFNGLGFLMKSFFWRRSASNESSVMWLSYFKMAKRSLMASKTTSTVNIVGLITGIASCLILLAVIGYEESFDKTHSNFKNIYRVIRYESNYDDFSAGISFPVSRAIRDEVSDVKTVVAMEYFGGANVNILDERGTTEKKFREEAGFALVEPTFFKVFDFGNSLRWISGNPETSLINPFEMVLTQSMARKYFGDDDPIGRVIRLQQKYDCKITGVIEDLPSNSDFPFTVLISYASVKTLAGDYAYESWFAVNSSHHVFIEIPEGKSIERIEQQIAKVHSTHAPKDLYEARNYRLQKLGQVHHDARVTNFRGRTITEPTILGLKVVALFLLLTAAINYINLSTAHAALRSKEIGLRKVMGSSRMQVMKQFFTETFLLVCIASMIAIGLSQILLGNIESVLNLPIPATVFVEPHMISKLLLIVVGVTFFAGLYPCLIMSGYNPVTALKNRFVERSGGSGLRKILVIVQFTITQVLVVGTYIVLTQLNHFKNTDMGFNQDGIITLRLPDKTPSKLDALANKLRAQSFVSNISFSNTMPSGLRRNRSYADIGRLDAAALADYKMYEIISIDTSWLSLYDIQLKAGRMLTPQDSISAVLVNEKLVQNLNLGTTDQAVGQEIKITDGRRLRITGVIGNYYGNSFKEDVENAILSIDPENYNTLNIKVNGNASLSEAIPKMEAIWNTEFPDLVFTYRFLDENIKAFYEQEEKYAKLFQWFSVVFLLIGCLGLYGLVTFLVNRKSKEVAVRKVLGAAMRDILYLFSWDYIKLITLSFIISVPIAYYFSIQWLEKSANHISLTWWIFALPGAAILVVAVSVVLLKSFRTAQANPVDKLKYE